MADCWCSRSHPNVTAGALGRFFRFDRSTGVRVKVLLVNPNVLTPEVFPAGMEYTAEHLIGTGEHEISIMDMNTQDDVATAVQGQDLVLMGVRNVDSGMDNEAPELPLIKSIVGRFRDAYDGP